MRVSTARCRGLGVLAAVALVLALPAAAPAAMSSTATLAPIGSASYLLTVTNTGTETIGGLLVEAPNAAGVVSDGGCLLLVGGFICDTPIPVGASLRACYNGSAPTSVRPGGGAHVPPTDAPATSCPLAGFTPAAGGGGTPTPTPPAPATPAPATPAPATPSPSIPAKTTPKKTVKKQSVKWKRARCVSTYKSWKRSHKRATKKQKNAQQKKLRKLYGCSLSAFR